MTFFTDFASATPSSLTVSVSSGADPKVYVAPTASGNFATSTAATFSVTTTHATGYSLSASTTAMTDGTNTIPTHNVSAGVSADNYADNTYATTNNLNNTWAYLPSKYDSSVNTLYLPAPITTTQTIDETSSSTTGGPYTVSIGTRIDNNMPRGSYSSTLTLIATAKPTPYSITYNQNTTDTVTNMPTNASGVYSNSEVATNAVSSTIPARDGYAFKGWCTVQTADDAACTGITYNPDGASTSLDLTLDQTAASNNFTLYAVWKSNDPCLGLTDLYDLVACRSKGKQTAADLQIAITVPTSANWVKDTSNSGVYEYDPSVFGVASDAANTSTIYYYRGVLENSVGSYGSDGSAATYPNYVVLSSATSKSGLTTTDTCWRIVRTTGSGGIKMIYNGLWTGSTCANATTAAQVITQSFNAASPVDSRRIIRVGYTYNADYDSTTASTPAGTLFGTNSNYSGNDDNSMIKTYIEGTWFSTISAYESILEPSAGYCNDRTVYNTSNVLQPESTSISQPYATSVASSTEYKFGARTRNMTTAQSPSLTCATYGSVDRSVVDLYTTSSANNGNKQLAKPAALLTADEMSFSGSGSSTATNGSNYHSNSFLRSGSTFWLLSPSLRGTSGSAFEFYLYSDGNLNSYDMSSTYGVRPAISLTSGMTVTSGSGTATDPWVVNAP